MGNPDLAHLPTAEEYALYREAYAETYPVRPLMNAIDAKDAEIERLTRERDEAQERFEELRDVVYNEANVERDRLRTELERMTYERDQAEERSKACDQIADGDYGWQNLAPLCMATMSVCRLRSNYERLRAALERLEEGLQCGGGHGALNTDHYCPNCDNSLFRLHEIAREALREEKRDE